MVVLEGRSDTLGDKAAKVYAEASITITVMLDAAVGYVIERTKLVVVGAKGVVENEIIVNKMETYAMVTAARDLGKPFYVTTDSYNCTRLFPLNQ